MTGTKLLVVEDQALLRQSLVAVVRLDPRIAAVAEASNGAEAVQLCRDHDFDVVLMDIQMPVLDGISATAQIVEASPETKVVMLTAFEQDDYVYRALRAGASGFLLKDSTPISIVDAVLAVHSGQALVSPASLRQLVARYTPRRIEAPEVTGLTPRQTEILALVAKGLSNQEIEDHLVITHATLKSHMSALLAKLGARDRAQLVIVAYQLGIVRA